MDKHNPLLPFAFTSSSFNDKIPLNTTPRERSIIDENARSKYHTRVTASPLARPKLTNASLVPSLKRRMGESFNEKDDIKRREVVMDVSSDQPTEVDEDEDEYEHNYQGADKYGDTDPSINCRYLPPSSPPVEPPLLSEFDLSTNTTSNFNVPESPPRHQLSHRDKVHMLPSEIDDDSSYFTSSKRSHPFSSTINNINNPNITNPSSDADFGIDKFHRFKGSINLPSSANDIDQDEIEYIRQRSYNKARATILDCFEEIRPIINLEGLNLYEIPDEIKDLNKIVIFDMELDQDKKFQLFLTNNNLYELSPSLFKFTKLNVLGLRQNKLKTLPPLIEKLINLTDLSLGTNKLNYLPFQILNLPLLQMFQAGPNPFMPIPTDAIPLNTNENHIHIPDKNRELKYISTINYLGSTKVKPVPSLKTLCLNKIANYDVTYQETKDWKKFTPKIYHHLIIKAIKGGKYRDHCSSCTNIIVEPVAEIFEWWNLLQNKNIPIRRQFCSGGCLSRYDYYDHYNSLT